MTGGGASTCRSCGQPIRWAKSRDGKNIPLDLQPSPQGTLRLDNGVAEYVKPADRQGNLYLSHFVTCPQSRDWRKKP